MLLNLKIESIKKIGYRTKYLEFIVLYLSLFTIIFLESAKEYSNTIMLWTVIFIIYTRISILFARQRAILRLLKSSPLLGASRTSLPKQPKEV